MSNSVKRGISVPESAISYGRLWRGPMEVVDGVEIGSLFLSAGGGHPTDMVSERFLIRTDGQMQSYDAIGDSLLEPFLRLDSTEEAIYEFATRFGYLSNPVRILKADLIPQTVIEGERISLWVNELQTLKNVFELFGAWRRKDTAELEKRIAWHFTAAQTVRIVEYIAPSGHRIPIADSRFTNEQNRLKQFAEGDVYGPAIFNVQTSVNRYLLENTATQLYWGMEFAGESRRFVGLEPDRHSPSLFLVPTNLLGAIWLQFANMINSRCGMRRCIICGNLFAIGGGRQTARRKDARCCSNRCRWGQRKRARDLFREGYSLKEIAKILEAKQTIVKGWVGRSK